MGSRSSHLRTKVIALLASLVALWAFAAWVTLRDGLNLLWVQTYNSGVYVPSEPLVLELQMERRLSAVYLGEPSGQARKALEEQRRRTDQAAATFRTSSQDWWVRQTTSEELDQRIDEVTGGLDALVALRGAVDDRSAERAEAQASFTELVNSIFRMFASMGNVDDQQIADDTATLIEFNRARDILAQEDALLSGAIAAGKMSRDEQAQFVQLVGLQRFLATEAMASLPAADDARYKEMVAGATFSQFQALENRVISGRGTEPPVSGEEWRSAADPALAEMQRVMLAAGTAIVDRATPVAAGVILRMVLAAGLGLAAVVASIVVSITTARSLLQQLQRLREAAWQLANERLPGVVTRLGHGENVDVAAEAPPLAFGADEIGQVGQAFNEVQQTAIKTAVEQAELRRSVRDVFLSLARRTQALVHRQLTVLDAMERREQDATELEDLFRIDHLATRMRRNAENLIVLSGSSPARTWRRNVPMVDVIRGAVAEVEDYARVTVMPIGQVSLVGRAVGDIIHLLAELVENALSFSPPHTEVKITGQMVANGFVIEIEDRGLGMSQEELAAANAQIASTSDFRLSGAARLGLFVVSRLTQRHEVRVRLKESVYGGTTAVVLIPRTLVTDGKTEGAAAPSEPPAVEANAARSSGNGRTQEGPQVRASGVVTADPPSQPGMPWPPHAAPEQQRRTAPPEQRSTVRQEVATIHSGSAGDPAADRVPAAAQPAAEGSLTPSGLPVRVRQASIAPPLAGDGAGASGPTSEEGVRREPDQIRKMMSSYQTGTRRGRSQSERLSGDGPEPPSSPAGM